MSAEGPHVVVLGGGLAGLSCAYEMAKAGVRVTVLEREPHVGGMANSFTEGDPATAGEPGSDYWSYDYGPHRFHTDETELIRHVEEILGQNQTRATRLSRILMKGKFYDYPIEVVNVLKSMPPLRILMVVLSYLWTRIADLTRIRRYEDRHFAEWTERRFGKVLSQMFFVEYTEKAWGMPATEISADWASQRITLLDLRDTVMRAVFRPRGSGGPRTLVTDFIYPKVGGIGELARGYRRRIEEMGGVVLTDAIAVKVIRDGDRVTSVEYRLRGEGKRMIEGDHFVSTIPVTAMAKSVQPPPPREVRDAIDALDYVAIVFVYLKIDKPQVSPDNWVYLPEKHLTVHRISEYKNFSPHCAPAEKTLVCAEITCRVGDHIWKADSDMLRDIAVADLHAARLLEPEEVLDSFTKRIPYAYPIYDLAYADNLELIMEFVHGLTNIRTGGRQGLFRYNNMDQSIEMGRRMADAISTGGDADHESVATDNKLFEYGALGEVDVDRLPPRR